MDPARRASAVYGNAKTSIKTPRQVEYQAFAKVTTDLRRTADLGREGFPRLAEALHVNMRLWTIIAGNVAEDGNELPSQLRAQLFYLADFTREHTRKVLRGDEPVAPLIDVNLAIMKGLSHQEESAVCPA
ncbi:MAG: flagellar biosynthesis regulator FlaF [Pseudomonadota bacterium]